MAVPFARKTSLCSLQAWKAYSSQRWQYKCWRQAKLKYTIPRKQEKWSDYRLLLGDTKSYHIEKTFSAKRFMFYQWMRYKSEVLSRQSSWKYSSGWTENRKDYLEQKHVSAHLKEVFPGWFLINSSVIKLLSHKQLHFSRVYCIPYISSFSSQEEERIMENKKTMGMRQKIQN